MSNEKKTQQLGEPFGTASHKLRKSILFYLLIQLNQNVCFRCNKDICSVLELSIEHKKSWLDSDNPKFNFYDLNNIAFSHLSCNSSAASKSYLTDEFKSKIKHKGKLNPNSKLSEQDVIEIKTSSPGLTYEELARRYGVSEYAIYSIKKNKTWNHLSNPTSLV